MIISIWNEAHVEALKKLWAEGYSAALIAERLSTTRNGVLGKIHRLGLSGRDPELLHKGKSGPKPQKPKANRTVRISRPSHNALSMRSTRIESAEYKLRCVEIVPRHLSIIDLEANDCRYPYGDETISFCGHPKQAGSSYCTPHFHLCRIEPYARKVAA